MGIMAMKVPSRGTIFRDGGIKTMEQAMRYVLSLPISTAVVGISTLAQLEENVQIAKDFIPLAAEEMAEMECLTRAYYTDVLWYRDHM
jgi:predicted aldo/keto reductase-like oxidoreductase